MRIQILVVGFKGLIRANIKSKNWVLSLLIYRNELFKYVIIQYD